jgi:nitroreductase
VTARLRRILDLARWAPSGDNSQPWRFDIRSPRHVVVHAITDGLGVYDLEGSAALVSVGAMLETMRIAASAERCSVAHEVRSTAAKRGALIDVRIEESPDVVPDSLLAFIRERSVQRRSLAMRALGAEQKRALEQAVGNDYRVLWFEEARERLRMAWLAVRSAKIRLTIPEAWEVHRRIIEWDARFSADRIPDQALGSDTLSVRSMRWVLESWPRVERMNRWFGATLLPRLQLELIPGVRCAAHFAIVAEREARDPDDHLRAGAAAQRFWLTATRLGLQLQPQHTPLMFAGYARRGIRFSEVAAARRRAELIDVMLVGLLDGEAANAVFLGRLGHGAAPGARSLRLSLDQLLIGAGTAVPDRVDPPLT